MQFERYVQLNYSSKYLHCQTLILESKIYSLYFSIIVTRKVILFSHTKLDPMQSNNPSSECYFQYFINKIKTSRNIHVTCCSIYISNIFNTCEKFNIETFRLDS